MMDDPSRRGLGWATALLCLAAGVVLFLSLDHLWPLADTDLTVSHAELRAEADAFLASRGFDLTGFRSARRLTVDTEALDYVDRRLGRERAQRWIRQGRPLVSYLVQYKKRGETIAYAVRLHPTAGVLGWAKLVDEEYPGARLEGTHTIKFDSDDYFDVLRFLTFMR